MKRYLVCTWVSVLVNGSARGEFNIERGVRQCCTLFPLLFKLVAEFLPILVNQFDVNGWLQGVGIHEVMESTIVLQYAEDSILFLRYSED